MNCSSPRSIALAILLTLHGIAILCGPAIHRRERHAWPSRARAGTGWAALSSKVGLADTDCPICHFLAQGQLGTARAEIVVYPGALHEFDHANTPVRPRGGGAGVAHGANGSARNDAFKRVSEWLAR